MVEPMAYCPEMARLTSGLRSAGNSCCIFSSEMLLTNHRLSKVGYDAMARISPVFGSWITAAPAGAEKV